VRLTRSPHRLLERRGQQGGRSTSGEGSPVGRMLRKYW
jgi:hypothetical protein